MTDISITAGNVVPANNAIIERGTAGATITAGQVVYLDTSDNRYKLADADSATAAVRAARGIALNGASAGQPLAVQTGGDLTIGATIAAGVSYYLSAGTAGGICPIADLGQDDYPVLVGMGKSTTLLKVAIVDPGAALAA